MSSTHWVKSSALGNSYILLSMCYVEIDCILILIIIFYFFLVYVLVFVFYLINCQIALVRQMLSEPDNKNE